MVKVYLYNQNKICSFSNSKGMAWADRHSQTWLKGFINVAEIVELRTTYRLTPDPDFMVSGTFFNLPILIQTRIFSQINIFTTFKLWKLTLMMIFIFRGATVNWKATFYILLYAEVLLCNQCCNLKVIHSMSTWTANNHSNLQNYNNYWKVEWNVTNLAVNIFNIVTNILKNCIRSE